MDVRNHHPRAAKRWVASDRICFNVFSLCLRLSSEGIVLEKRKTDPCLLILD